MIDVLVLGQIVLDIIVQGLKPEYLSLKQRKMENPVRFSVGGDAQNASVTMAYLGLNTWLSGRIGGDDAGRFCMELCSRSGVNISRVVRAEGGATATTFNAAGEDGEASMLAFPGENQNYNNADVPFDLFKEAAFVSLHSLFVLPGIDVPGIFRAAKAAGARTFADTTTWRGTEKIESLKDVFPLLDIFCPSYEEASKLCGISDPEKIARYYHSLGPETVVIKLGGKGCLAYNGKETLEIPAFPCDVVNTTGAGDSFTAGFLYGLCRGYSLEGAAKCGNAAGAITAASPFTSGAVRSEKQLLDYIAAAGIAAG